MKEANHEFTRNDTKREISGLGAVLSFVSFRVNSWLSLSRAALFLFLSFALALGLTTGVRAQTPEQDEEDENSEIRVPPKSKEPTTPSKSTVRGRVIYDDTNRPVRRARIMLLRADGSGGPEKTGATDERGEFRIKEVGAGSYFIAVDSPGIITPFSQIDLGEAMNNEKATISAVRKDFQEVSVNGTNSVEVMVRAKRGGIITGRVTYADGDAAVNVPIIILRKKDNRLIRFITSYSPVALLGFKTDDRGIYRITGLPPGEYVVGAAESYGVNDEARNEYSEYALFGRGSLSTSYYQNESTPQQATPIKVEAAQEASEINITLADRSTYTVSGTIVARQTRRPLRARVHIQPKSEEGESAFPIDFGPSGITTNPQGQWTIPNVPDGTYVLTVEPIENSDMLMDDVQPVAIDDNTQVTQTSKRPQRPAPPAFTSGRKEITVAGADLPSIVIELSEGGRIQGTVMLEGSKKFTQGGMPLLLVAAGGKKAFYKSGYANEEGKFVFDGIPPGEFFIYLPDSAGEFYIKSITAGGADLLREPLKIGQGTNVDNVVITVSSEVGILTGRVLSSEDTKPVRGASVLVVSSDPARWRSANSFLFGSTDTEGTFKITAAPGAYLVIPLAASDQLGGIGEALVRARASTAKQVTLQPNGRETVELIAPPEQQR